MATGAVTSTLGMVPQILSSVDLKYATGIEEGDKAQAEADDRSSSLSDLGYRTGVEPSSHAGSEEVNDTEAETERLEDSPQKQRRHQDVVLTSVSGIYDDQQNLATARALPENFSNLGLSSTGDIPLEVANSASDPGSEGERLEQTSDISSVEDSGEESGKDLSPSSSSLVKRKRSNFEEDSASEQDAMHEPSAKAMKLFDGGAAEASTKLDPLIQPVAPAEDYDMQVIADAALSPSNEKQPRKPQALTKQKHQKGKRKGKKTPDHETGNTQNAPVGTNTVEHGGNAEAMYSNEEDAQMENMAEGVEVENPVKMEELAEKKSAMDSLSAIEKCFARLRDKIYEERIAQCNQELAVLEQPVPIHPELLAMKEAIDQRRDQKLEYENNLMKFKLMTLQRESIANKAQAHSQYMQTVREVRDIYLESLNKNYYQVQRERRNCEGDVPDYMYTFTTKRSQQITHQTAYNTEVSILAGVAKYVGFPAAPEISSARSMEIDDDFRSMGIASGAAQIAQNHHPALRANLSATTSFPRQRPEAEEHFLEQNPWANPQHPAHHQHLMQRQVTPSVTPTGQRRLVDLTEPQGSASTIAEAQSGPNSSMAPTPAAGEASKSAHSGRDLEMRESIVDSTPTRRINGSLVDFSQAVRDSSRAKADTKSSPSLPRNMSTVGQAPNALPKPLPFMHTGGSTLGIRTSTPVRYPIIKAEDANAASLHLPIPHQFHGPAAVSIASNGPLNRFAG